MSGEGVKAPMCDLCKTAHWGREPHVWKKRTPEQSTKVSAVKSRDLRRRQSDRKKTGR